MKLTLARLDLLRDIAPALGDALQNMVTRINAWSGVNHRPDGTHLFVWTPITYDAASFTGNNAMTWTVAQTSVARLHWRRIDTTVTIRIILNTTTVGGVPSTRLQIRLPAALIPPRTIFSTGSGLDNGVSTTLVGFISITVDPSLLLITRADAAAWTAGPASVWLTMDYEVV
jgi:hypothetical protein